MSVIATAGHVDHGKSTLIRMLTGMEPDRWAEEQRRGLTIDLGFAWTSLPSGQTVAFVDVPGHERFVTNMLAGVGPVSAVMFVVAADGGWMPQSAEHLDALHALGVRHGLLVVTRADLADPAPVREHALRELAATSLGQVESVTVSAVTGQGIDQVRDALDRLAARLPAPDAGAPVRLWVDRAFTIRGAGTVVTGTLGAGTLRGGDELAVAPGGIQVRVRGLQSLKRASDEVVATTRVAVNLRGVAPEDVRRGTALLTPGHWFTTDLIDVRLEPAGGLPEELVLHIGAAAVAVRVRPLSERDARLTLSVPLPLCVADRALLRDPGGRRIVAGITVLDVGPPRLARRGAAAARARELAAAEGVPDGADIVRWRGMIREPELGAMGCSVPPVPRLGDWLIDPDHLELLRKRLAEVVDRHAAEHPLDPGMPKEAARRALGLPDRRLVDSLAGAAKDLRVAVREGRLVIGRGPELPPALRAALTALRRDFDAEPFAAPDAERMAELGLTPKLAGAAVRAGALIRIADGVYLPPGAPERARGVLAGLPQPFTVSQARMALRTSRRVAVPLLEMLDARGLTSCLPDRRRRVREQG